jgi:hypothetical protein
MRSIGTLAEKSLHAGIKAWYGRADDQFEVPLDGYVIDILRGEQLIEIQTGNFTALKTKLGRLLEKHQVHLLYPVAVEKWVVRETAVGHPLSRRKSPKHGRTLDVFHELVRIHHLLPHPNLTVGVLLSEQEEVWRDDGRGSWRRKHWSIHDRRLLAVNEEVVFTCAADLLGLLPGGLARPFTNRQLAETAVIPPRLAQRITYTLRHCELLTTVGKEGNSYLYDFNWGM